MGYCVSGIRNWQNEREYWDLLREYHGSGEFIPFEEGGDEGRFNVFIGSDEEIDFRSLQGKFHSLEILSLEKIAA